MSQNNQPTIEEIKKQCTGTNCHALDGVNHSRECQNEHDNIVADAAEADFVRGGGWPCDFRGSGWKCRVASCGYSGQDNQPNKIFCAGCHRQR